MSFRKLWIAVFLLTVLTSVFGSPAAGADSERWALSSDGGIRWEIAPDADLPHNDHMEMAGFTVDMILEWSVSKEAQFGATRVIRWPLLRTIPDNTHASLEVRLSDQDDPRPLVDGKKLSPGHTTEVEIHGLLKAVSNHDEGLRVTHTIFPSAQSPVVLFKSKSAFRNGINRMRPIPKRAYSVDTLLNNR